MSAQIIPFAFNDNLVRTVIIDGEPWFVAVDACNVLQLANVTRSLDRLDPDEKGLHTVKTLGGIQDVNIISEAGVYRLVFTSRKAEAEQFKRWLAHEVLPQLRRTGRYGAEVEQDHSGPEARLEQEATAVTALRLSMVREARLIFGHDRARALWSFLGLPAVPQSQPEGAQEPYQMLAALWNLRLDPESTLREALMIEAAGGTRHPALVDHARCVSWRGRDFVALVIGSALIGAGLAQSTDAGAWSRVLRRLPGADQAVVRFSGQTRRCILVPALCLDEDNTVWQAA